MTKTKRIVLGEKPKKGVEGFIDAVKDDTAYGYVCNHYELTKDELRLICKELLYAIYRCNDDVAKEEIAEQTCEGLDEALFWGGL